VGLRAIFRLIVVQANFGLLVLSGLWLDSERSNLLDGKKEQVRNLIDLPYSIIAADYQLERGLNQTVGAHDFSWPVSGELPDRERNAIDERLPSIHRRGKCPNPFSPRTRARVASMRGDGTM
jgi:hypothetical protein